MSITSAVAKIFTKRSPLETVTERLEVRKKELRDTQKLEADTTAKLKRLRAEQMLGRSVDAALLTKTNEDRHALRDRLEELSEELEALSDAQRTAAHEALAADLATAMEHDRHRSARRLELRKTAAVQVAALGKTLAELGFVWHLGNHTPSQFVEQIANILRLQDESNRSFDHETLQDEVAKVLTPELLAGIAEQKNEDRAHEARRRKLEADGVIQVIRGATEKVTGKPFRSIAASSRCPNRCSSPVRVIGDGEPFDETRVHKCCCSRCGLSFETFVPPAHYKA